MFKILSISLFVFISFRGISQDSVAVHFVFPSQNKYEIRIDNNKVYKTKDFNLSAGKHKIEIWVPGLQLRTDSIYVNLDSYNLYRYKVTEREPVIPDYRRNKLKYLLKKSIPLSSYVPTGVLGYFTVSKYLTAKSIFSEVESLKKSYDLSLNSNEMGSIANRIDDLIKQYDQSRKEMRWLGVSTTAMLFANIGLTYLFNKFNEKPVKFHKTSPFERASIGVSCDFNTSEITLKLKI